MALCDLRASLKHRIHAAIDRYQHQRPLRPPRPRISQAGLAKLPPVTASMIVVQLDALDQLDIKIDALERRIHAEIARTPTVFPAL
jgi:transposase